MDACGPVVYVVDDDPSVLKAMGRLLNAAGFETRGFLSGCAFLREHDPDVSGCVLLDLAIPDLNGLDLQAMLMRLGGQPIVFLSGRGDIRTSVGAMKNGAVDFLTKPVNEKELLEAINEAIKRDNVARTKRKEITSARDRLATLSSRERQVFYRVVRGNLNKIIAADLGIVEKTVKVRRANMMRKMNVRTLAELVHVAGLVSLDSRNTDARMTMASDQLISPSAL